MATRTLLLLATVLLGLFSTGIAEQHLGRRGLLQAMMNPPIIFSEASAGSGGYGGAPRAAPPTKKQGNRNLLQRLMPTSNTIADSSRDFLQSFQPGAASAGRPGTQQLPTSYQNAWGVPTGGGLKQPRGQGFGGSGSSSQGQGFGAGGLTPQGLDNSWSQPAAWQQLQQPAGGWGSAPTQRPGDRINNKGNKQSLDPLIGSINNYPKIRPQPITVTGTANTLAQGVRRKGNARAAAQSLAQAYSSGQVDAAAEAIASAATTTDGGAAITDASAVAETLAATTAYNPTVAPGLLAKSAGYAVNKGQTDRYARTMANAFGVARRNKAVPQMTTAVADAIAQGGADTRYAMGTAIAQAVADGGDSQAAIAEATAAAFCSGGSTASAWASAYAVALSQDSRGCLVLNQAKALAQSSCGNGAADSLSKAQATSLVLGFCGLLDMIPGGINMGWGGGNSGSNTAGLGGFADGNGFGATGGGNTFGGLVQQPGSSFFGGR